MTSRENRDAGVFTTTVATNTMVTRLDAYESADRRDHRDRRVRRAVLSLCLLGLLVPPLAAHAQPAGPRPGEVETAPIKCWWKTDRTSIRVGERFALTLTCAVIETRSVTVVPTLTQIDPGALQIPPFEVVGGSKHDDVLAPPWRYIQYDYKVRFLGEGFFGQDVVIPPLTVTYAIKAASGNGAEGRDLSYILPAMPLRVMSLVPKDNADIRDASSETFGDVETRRFQSRTAYLVATILFAAAAALVLIGAARVFGRSRARTPGAVRTMRPVFVLGGVVRSLNALRADVARDGWTPALARRAAALLRVAGAVGLGRPVAQAPADRSASERDGQVILRRGIVRRRRFAVSAATTPRTIDHALSNGQRPAPATRAALERIGDSLQTFGAAGYGRGPELDLVTLNAALEQGTEAVKRLRARALIPMRAAS
jgi:hypothetical protein